MLAVVLEHMRDRLQAGARDDLLEMAQVTHVKSWTARLLWENGFRTVRALADADPKDIVPVLIMVFLLDVSSTCPILRFYRPDLEKVNLIRTRKKRLNGTQRK
jgi:hypothetical protein